MKKSQTPPDAMRCAMYARYSPKPEGAVGENYSIASQIAAMREALARDYGCQKPDEYIDRNISGKDLNRPDLDRLRDAVALGRYDVVMAYSPDRLARNHIDTLVLLQELKKRGAQLTFVSGRVEDSPEGDLSLGVQSLVAEYERKKLAERSRRGRKQKAREGFWTGGAAFGYRYRGHKEQSRGELVIVPEQAKVVVQIFQWAGDGETSYQIAARLNEAGIRTATGKRWFGSTVSQTLKKTVYYGEALGPAGIVVKTDAILSREFWQRAFDAKRRNLIGKVGRPSKQYLLTGRLWCAECGARCRTYPRGFGPKSPTYRCNGIDHYTNKRKCAAGHVLQSKLETAVWDAIVERITDPDLLWTGIEAYYDRAVAKPKGKKDAAALRIERARRIVERAKAVLLDADSPLPYAEAKANLQQAQQELAEAQTAQPAALIELPERRDVRALAAEFAHVRGMQEFAHRRGVVERVVQKIRWHSKKREAEITCGISMTPEKNCNRDVQPYCNNSRVYSFVITRQVA